VTFTVARSPSIPNFSAVQPQREDLIITLGDYVDHGPDAKGVIDRLITLDKTNQLVALRGNHEQMMLNCCQDRKISGWLQMGGKATLSSYSVSDKLSLLDVPDNHWDFLENKCVNWYETDQYLFVHADADPHLPLAEQQKPGFLPKSLLGCKNCLRNPVSSVFGANMIVLTHTFLGKQLFTDIKL